MSVLEIKDLHVEIEGKEILKGVNLTLKTGEIAAIMGPNGTGKSSLVWGSSWLCNTHQKFQELPMLNSFVQP